MFNIVDNCDGDGSAVESDSGPGVKRPSKFAKSRRLISPYISRPHGPEVLIRRLLGRLEGALVVMVLEGGTLSTLASGVAEG